MVLRLDLVRGVDGGNVAGHPATAGTAGRPATPGAPTALGSRLWQLGNEAHRHAQLVELEVGPEESDRPIGARLPRNLDDIDARFGERPLRLDRSRSVFTGHVVLN